MVTTRALPVGGGGVVAFGQSLSTVATLYASKKLSRSFSEKNFRLSLVVAAGGAKKKELAHADVG